ncbi:SPFH domain-containing protein [Candidatus Thiothrix anitrata]|jgi:membrane protease subunit (stomatin/prohibitin family)|uniref:SPFH domain-containing protein n=1 Tax=Candidatus Thiothrix anitrata TaxID=2823902 RepID=A0ABX7X066_9GAMM|nr:SPFH domain-containing protein [Candidatus Thiothrix anitrata]QTR49309.1 SPFH domain-containing protein [Candidatus Thiothrix anitrata]
MGLWDKLMGEFVDVIEWTDDSNDTMVYRFERHGNEIKYGAKLTVRESQVAIFVNEGQIADVLTPGMYVLETQNLPVLSTLQHWDHGFQSPFKAEVYFFNTKQFTNLKWGTSNPVIIRDSEFAAVRLRAFGTYTIRIEDARQFMLEIIGTDGHFTVDEISSQLRSMIVTRFSSVAASANIPVLDMAANYEQFGQYITQRIAPEFKSYGIQLTAIMVENISLPDEVEAALDKRTSMGMVGNLDQYLQFQTAQGIGNGGSNSALDMGMGFAVANKMAEVLNKPTAAAPPPLPDNTWHIAINQTPSGPHSLQQLQQMVSSGTLTTATLVWQNGMASWQAAGEVSALATLFNAQTPPPLPPM